jgi:Pyridoxamine 5'-phosphate oxidase
MGKTLPAITDELAAWLERQRLFFVATSPLSPDGCVNCSPKGGDSFRVLGPLEAAYLDLTGSGVETIAHLRENGRIVLLFCAFEGAPGLVRLHGRGEAVLPGDQRFQPLLARFPSRPGVRSIIRVEVTRVGSSCGFGVPILRLDEERDVLDRWAGAKAPEEMEEYRCKRNARSIDGLPGWPPADPEAGQLRIAL